MAAVTLHKTRKQGLDRGRDLEWRFKRVRQKSHVSSLPARTTLPGAHQSHNMPDFPPF